MRSYHESRTMKPIYAVAALVLALTIGAWLLISPESKVEPDVGREAAPAAAPLAPGVLDASAVPLPVSPGGIESRTAVDPLPAADLAETSLYAAPAPDGEGFLVRVVEAESKKPIPYADILFVDVGQLDEQAVQARMAELRDIDALIEALATRYRAGADGSVRLPLPTREVWVAARKDPWFGMTQEQSIPSGGITIECQLSLSVAGRVVNEVGVPQAGIPVDLLIGDEDRKDRVISIVTGEDGIARIRRLEMFLRDAGRAQTALAIGGLLGMTVAQEFDLANPPSSPLELVLPPCGMVEVLVEDADGKPWAVPAMVHLTIASPDQADENDADQNRGAGSSAFVKDGFAQFTPAGLGQIFHARASRADGSLIGEMAGPGPLNAGDRVRLVVREFTGSSFVVGRVLGLDGKPLASARLGIEIEQRGPGRGSSQGNNLRTDPAGRFRYQIEDPSLPAGVKRTLTVSQNPRGSSGAAAKLDLSYNLPPGDVDVGDLRLGLAALVASGIVVDEEGRPVANAHVVMQQKVAYGSAAEEYYWNWIQGGEAFTLADGLFALHNDAEGDEFMISCRSADFWCEGVVTARGTGGLRLVLRRGGSLRGTLLVDEGMRVEDLRVELSIPGAPPDPWGRNTAPVQKPGNFVLNVLPPGNYTLRLRDNQSDFTFLELQGLAVVAGAACDDPRLNPLDARGRTASFMLRAQDAAGKPIPQFSVYVMEHGEEMTNFWTQDGEIRLPMTGRPVDLIIQSEGFLRASVPGVSSDQTVTLRRAPSVRIQITNPGLVPAGFTLMVRLDPVADRELQIWSDSNAIVGADGWAECPAVAYGVSTIQAVLMLRTESGSRGWGLHHDLGEIEIRDGGAAQVFQITLNEEDVAKTVERLNQGS